MNDYDNPGLFAQLSQSMTEGGFVMWPIAALGCLLPLIAFGLLIVTVVGKKHALLFGALVLMGVGTSVALAAVGQTLAMRSAEAAIVHADPEDRDIIRIAARGEAMAAMTWALGGSVLPTFLGFLLLGLGASRLERFKT